MKYLLTVLILLLLSGCVTTDYNYIPGSTDISEPALNTVVSVNVGNTMLRQGQFTEHEAIFLNEEVRIGTGMIAAYRLSPGFYLKKGEEGNSEFYLPLSKGPHAATVTLDPFTDPFEAVVVEKKSGRLCAISVFKIKACNRKASFDRRMYPIATENALQQTLIYRGKVGDKINISYREFSNDVARPAFNHDVEYDLSESMTIGYKGAQIEIIEATNELIRYKVLRNFNKAEF